MRLLLLLFLSFTLVINTNAQDKKDLAKVYFKKALNSYKELNLEKTTKYLEKNKELSNGIYLEKVAVFGSKFFYELGNYKKAEEYFKAFFKINKNKSSANYKAMLLAYTDNLDALENPTIAVNKLIVLKKEKEKQDAIDNADKIKQKQQEISRLKKSISSLEKSLSYISNKSSSQYLNMQSTLEEMKKKLLSYGVSVAKPSSNLVSNLNNNSGTIKKENGKKTNNLKSSEAVSFAVIETPPVFPGCKGSNKAKKDCFSLQFQKHFSRKFNTDLPNELGLPAGKKRVLIKYTIDKNGNIVDVEARAPHIKIKEEILRVISSLPRMKPATQRGKPVNVVFSTPFTLLVN